MSDRYSTDAVELAINRVLAAEKSARDAVELCRAEARQAVNRARLQSRQILERADERIGLLHHRCEESVSSRLAQLAAEAKRIPERAVVGPEMEERLRAACRNLAEQMTSGAAE